jgi:hydrogenase maturation protease
MAAQASLCPLISTLILGMGNPLRGDDGFASAVLETLAQSDELAPEADLLEVGSGEIVEALCDPTYRRVFVVEAAEMGRRPGEWVRFTPESVKLASMDLTRCLTFHAAGLPEALAIGRVLDMLPSEIIIYAVQPLQISDWPGLSEPVQQAVTQTCAAILAEVRRATPEVQPGPCGQIPLINRQRE